MSDFPTTDAISVTDLDRMIDECTKFSTKLPFLNLKKHTLKY